MLSKMHRKNLMSFGSIFQVILEAKLAGDAVPGGMRGVPGF